MTVKYTIHQLGMSDEYTSASVCTPRDIRISVPHEGMEYRVFARTTSSEPGRYSIRVRRWMVEDGEDEYLGCEQLEWTGRIGALFAHVFCTYPFEVAMEMSGLVCELKHCWD